MTGAHRVHKGNMVPPTLRALHHTGDSPQAAEDVTGEEGAQPAPLFDRTDTWLHLHRSSSPN